ncbi:tetratricopeptide repeat protein [Dankookia sp. P2]|uniref:tetratricopeptide repeat protein n=1 Tax=Dankookia sp. P2 TaxID=3423955 RepID=UPI003D66CD1C
MAWWGFVGTQPYMHAIAALGGLHSEMGNDQAARWCYERLLRMNPDDDQRIRDRLEAMAPTVGPACR